MKNNVFPPNPRLLPIFGGIPLALLFVGFSASPSVCGAAHFLPQLISGIDVNVILAPPPPPREEIIVERERPSRHHVWVRGYWVHRHGRHEWVAGHWELPPRGRTVWVEPRWEKRGHGYVFIDGYWAEPHREHEHDRR